MYMGAVVLDLAGLRRVSRRLRHRLRRLHAFRSETGSGFASSQRGMGSEVVDRGAGSLDKMEHLALKSSYVLLG